MRHILSTTIISLLSVASVEAKCPFKSVVVLGTVKQCETGAPVEGAKVFVFVEPYDVTLSSTSQEDPTEAVQATADGEFRSAGVLSTFKRYVWPGIHICTWKPKGVTIVVENPGCGTTRTRYKRRALVFEESESEMKLTLPEILIPCREHAA